MFTSDDSLSNDTLIIPSHGYSVNDELYFISVVGGTIPTEVTEGTTYYVQAVTDADRIQIATTQSAGSPLALTNGSGRIAKSLSKTITQNDIPEIAAGKIVIIDR